eukprot:364198-Chlamydomonas_euryale.AAC.13
MLCQDKVGCLLTTAVLVQREPHRHDISHIGHKDVHFYSAPAHVIAATACLAAVGGWCPSCEESHSLPHASGTAGIAASPSACACLSSSRAHVPAREVTQHSAAAMRTCAHARTHTHRH